MTPRDVHRNLTRALAVVMLVIGVAMIASVAWGASPSRVVIGVIFVVAGAGRLAIERRRGS